MFIGREREFGALNKLYKSNKFEFADIMKNQAKDWKAREYSIKYTFCNYVNKWKINFTKEMLVSGVKKKLFNETVHLMCRSSKGNKCLQ